MFQFKFTNETPIFNQIKIQIIRLIELDVLKPHDKLPSVRQLALELHVNPNTVMKAYCELENENYVYTIVKKGVFISDKKLDKQANTLLDEYQKMIRLLKNNNIGSDELIDLINKEYGGEANVEHN